MSTTETESKKSSSSKSSKKDSAEKKKKKDDDVPIEEVHTANNWEGADLGDDQRKQKFLRLMGAKKRKDETPTNRQDSHGSTHSDEGIPEKKHCRSKGEDESINRELEKQFNESLQSKINHTHHGGLGFHADSTSASNSDDWKQPHSSSTKFVAAKAETGDHVKVNEDEKVVESSSDKNETKKKKK